jgi:hypothetical protein
VRTDRTITSDQRNGLARAAARVAVAVALLTTWVSTTVWSSPAGATPVSTPLGDVSTVVAGVGSLSSIAVDPAGRIWYSNDTSVSRVDSGGHVTTWTDPSIKSPLSLTPGPGGTMWWVNRNGDSVSRVGADDALASFTAADLAGPVQMAAGPDGNLWFTEYGPGPQGTTPDGRVGRVTPAGQITTFPDPPGAWPRAIYPLGIAAGPDGAMWFANQGLGTTDSASIGRVTMDGTVSYLTDPAMQLTSFVTFGWDGTLWFENKAHSIIASRSPDGRVTQFDASAYNLASLGFLTSGPDGNVWFAATGGIGRITPSGQLAWMAIPGVPPAGANIAPAGDGSLLVSNGTDIVRVRPPVALGAPGAVTAKASADTGAQVRWSAPLSDGGSPITGYTVTASPGGQTCQWTSGPLRCAVALSPGTTYTFSVQATNANGPGLVSAPSGPLTTGSASAPPFGAIDHADGTGGAVHLTGWAIDPAALGPIEVGVAVDGVPSGGLVLADGSRPDLDAVLGFGPDHGYQINAPVPSGVHSVCVQAHPVAGAATQLGCRTLRVLTGSPVGSVDRAAAGPGTIHVGGWALDPDTTASISVAVYVDGKGVAWYPSSVARADIAAAFPGYGAAHGYDVTFSAGAGSHSVCVYAINTGPGANVALGCRSVTVPGGDPVGSLDAVNRVGSQVTVSGWALDPDTAASIPVAVYVEGRGIGWFTAGGTRGDIAAAYPGYGAGHGYSVTTPVLATDHHVCVYAINQGTGTTNTVLGCKTF